MIRAMKGWPSGPVAGRAGSVCGGKERLLVGIIHTWIRLVKKKIHRWKIWAIKNPAGAGLAWWFG
jgi:hypothetical protein